MALRLIIEDDEGTTTVVPLGADAITIGRQQGNTIQLTEKNVSRRHARLFSDEEAWFIEDLASYNGVKVNSAAVDGRLALKEGDVVEIGDYHITLTENADKTAVSPMPTAGAGAANDHPEEPMLASSSNDLPRLSGEELAALQSGPVPVLSMADSGAVPAAVAAPGGFEEERKSSAGLLIGAGAVVIGALVLAFAWMAGSGNDDAGNTAVAAAQRPRVAAAEAKAGDRGDLGNPGALVDSDSPGGPAPDGPPGVVDPTPTDTADSSANANPEVVLDEPGQPDAETEGTPDADTAGDRPKPRRKPKPRNTSNTSKKTPPPAPAQPEVDTTALLAEAKNASLTNYGKCYSSAKKAYDAKRSSEAADLMAKCACKMGDAVKAKKAAAKLRGTSRDNAVKLCELKGITL